ncbi:LysR substrate-binding domain-containing protein [Bradyrhizobium sp. Arg237L]|uniref:LysR substrate-binding domain-containing protein n=1 Tax=Bradyrhizobium sp. Arg237L TaxID=3003352 RepID=UPI00249ED8D0|nr:LysR substrate-binding domain-containing protein [Bradyrhizobium sp. Arg237L]MDI4231963.1 LysR substrate-binding domain-containing protein [Bradyrhizobium sp. Arg237L]
MLTPKAERLAPQLADALRDVRGLFREHEFDPAQEHRLIRLVISDANCIRLMPPLMARLAKEAPAAQIKLEGYGPSLVARMKKGELDFVLALATSPLPPGVESFVLGQDRMVLVTRRASSSFGQAAEAGRSRALSARCHFDLRRRAV